MIRQIWTHLRGERRNRDTPTDRKECASDKCTLPSAKPIPWWRILQKSQQLPTLFSVPSSELQISQIKTWTYCCLKISIGGLPLRCHPSKQQSHLQDALWRAWKSHTLAWELEQISWLQKSPLHSSLLLQVLQPYTDQLHLRFWGSRRRIWRAPAPPPGAAAQEMNAACPTSSGLMLNFNLFGHLLSCY